jgi:hypothetical protein
MKCYTQSKNSPKTKVMFAGARSLVTLDGVLNICPPSSSPSNVAVSVKIHTLLGVRLAENTEDGLVAFDVKARMEEKERRGGQISVGFALKVATNPNVAKYEVEGIAILQGKDEEIRKMLEVNPETQIPFVFQRVYQHVFMSMYVLSTLIDAPYPPANLLPSDQQFPRARMDANIASLEPQTIAQPAPAAHVDAVTPDDTQTTDTAETPATGIPPRDKRPT